MTGENEVVFTTLFGCKPDEIDLPNSVFLDIFNLNKTEAHVVMDAATAQVPISCLAMDEDNTTSQQPQTSLTQRINFYAAAPIVVGGVILGAVFVMDYFRRVSFSLFLKSAMLNFADVVVKVKRQTSNRNLLLTQICKPF